MTPWLVQPDQQSQNIVHFLMRQPRHRLIRDQQPGLRRHGPGEFQLAHFDLRQVRRPVIGLVRQTDHIQQGHDRSRGSITVATIARLHGVKDRDANILRQGQRAKRPRQLEAARHAQPGALMRRQSVQRMPVEPHLAAIVAQRAAQAIDQRALAGAIRTDQPQPLTGRHTQFDIGQRDEPTEAFAQTRHRQQWVGHRLNHPMMPSAPRRRKPPA